jgi:uncharacterized protein YbcC (UPF0753/DUF2309 family)
MNIAEELNCRADEAFSEIENQLQSTYLSYDDERINRLFDLVREKRRQAWKNHTHDWNELQEIRSK